MLRRDRMPMSTTKRRATPPEREAVEKTRNGMHRIPTVRHRTVTIHSITRGLSSYLLRRWRRGFRMILLAK